MSHSLPPPASLRDAAHLAPLPDQIEASVAIGAHHAFRVQSHLEGGGSFYEKSRKLPVA
jgi:hypothetical protein